MKLFQYNTMQEPVDISLRKAQFIFYELKSVLSGFHLLVILIPCVQYSDTSIIYLSQTELSSVF